MDASARKKFKVSLARPTVKEIPKTTTHSTLFNPSPQTSNLADVPFKERRTSDIRQPYSEEENLDNLT